MICVIIPVLNQIKWTDDCLKSLTEGTVLPSEIILIDNASTDPYKDLLEKYRSLNMLYIRNEENIGVNASWNLGLSITKRKNILFLNNDTYVNKYFIEKVIKVMENPEVGICSPDRERTSPNSPNMRLNNNFEETPEIQDCIYVEGWAFSIKRCIFEECGFIPPQFKTFMGDTYFFEWSHLLGYRNVVMCNNRVYHYGSKTLEDNYEDVQIRELHKYENHKWKHYLKSLNIKKKY